MTKRVRTRLLTALRVASGIGLLAYLHVAGTIDWSSFRSLVPAWPLALAALGLLFAVMFLSALRLWVLLRPQGFRISLLVAVRLTLVGMFFNAFMPGAGGGDLVKIYFAAGTAPGRGAEMGAVIVLDRTIGLLALITWPLFMASVFHALVTSTPIVRVMLLINSTAAVALLGLFLVFTSRFRSSRFVPWIANTAPLGIYVERIVETMSGYRTKTPVLATAFGISLVGQTLLIGSILILVRALAPASADWGVAILIPFGFFVNALPLTPGGLGVGEAAFHTLFRGAGFSGGIEALLAWRALTTLVDIWGFVFYLRGRQAFSVTSGPPVG